MKTKYLCASVMVVFFFLCNTREAIAQSNMSQYAEVFFDDFESDFRWLAGKLKTGPS